MRYPRSTVFILMFVSLSCASGYESKTDGGPSAGTCARTGLSLCGNECLDTARDPLNCGACGVSCKPAGDGSCFDGMCRCATDQDCGPGTQCKVGFCLPPDKNGRFCQNDAECGIATACVLKRCTATPCTDEVCDGFDNDCDGDVDEHEETVRACYTGPAGTKGVGICNGGTKYCSNGVYTPCLGETTPMKEAGLRRCDDLDNDCDGCVDGFNQETAACRPAATTFDFVFMIDNSGSMSDYIDTVKEASKGVASKFAGNPRFRFGLMDVASKDAFGHVAVLQPLTDFDTFRKALEAMPKDGYGTEPTYDAVYRTAAGMFDAELGFIPDSFRVYILMADENAKSIWSPLVTEASMCSEVAAGEILLTVVTLPEHFGDWDMCTAGHLFELSHDPTTIVADVEKILVLPCLKD